MKDKNIRALILYERELHADLERVVKHISWKLFKLTYSAYYLSVLKVFHTSRTVLPLDIFIWVAAQVINLKY